MILTVGGRIEICAHLRSRTAHGNEERQRRDQAADVHHAGLAFMHARLMASRGALGSISSREESARPIRTSPGLESCFRSGDSGRLSSQATPCPFFAHLISGATLLILRPPTLHP